MRVTFFLPNEPDLESLRSLDPDEHWREFLTGERAWILQTYLRLVRAGFQAEVSSEPPSDGLVLFHAKHRRRLMSRGRDLRGVILVSILGDKPRRPWISEFDILQNGQFADHSRSFFIPHWPQPGLEPRDVERGSTIRTIAYKGFVQNLDPAFQGAEWTAFLAELGIGWIMDTVTYDGRQTDAQCVDWSSYRTVDVIVAVRPPDSPQRNSKPATKLQNAWAAGVPAFLGREYAYRELRRSELDYVEIDSVEDARREVIRLAREPDRYRAMVENGLARARAFTHEVILQRWVELLYGTFPRLAGRRRNRLLRAVPVVIRRWLPGV